MINRIELPKEIIIASHNPGKVKEINILLNDIGIKAYPISLFSDIEPIENGNSFAENALIKARNAKRRLHKRSLKDTLKELRKTTKKVAASSTSTSIKKKPAKKAGRKKPAKKKAEAGDKRIYRMMEKLIMKKGKQVKAKVWRSEKLYNLKAGEKWLDIWAIAKP